MSQSILDENISFPRELSRKEQIRLREIQFDIKHAEKNLRRARTVLFILIGLNVISILIALGQGQISTGGNAIMLILIGLYGFAAMYCLKYPVLAFGATLSIYILLIFLAGLVDGNSFARGAIFKLIIIAYLSLGIYYGKELRKANNKLHEFLRE